MKRSAVRGISVNQTEVTFTMDGEPKRTALLTSMEISGWIDGSVEMTLRLWLPSCKESEEEMKRSAVRKKRPGPPRRGRVVDQKFIKWMHFEQPCLVKATRSITTKSQCQGTLTVHHVRTNGSPKDDRRVLKLCQAHHLHDFGPESIERLGKKEFEKRHGIDIEAAIREYNRQYEQCMADNSE
jgi:hypothetical protein